MTAYPRYITEFRWLVNGHLHDWSMPEGPVQSDLDEVADQIANHADAARDGILVNSASNVVRVTRMTEAGCTDWTEDALRFFAERAVKAGRDWPWWIDGGPEAPESADDRGFDRAREKKWEAA